MRSLEARAESIARAAERRRLENIAATISARGFFAEIGAGFVVGRGRKLLQAWLSDPLLRFAGRKGT